MGLGAEKVCVSPAEPRGTWGLAMSELALTYGPPSEDARLCLCELYNTIIAEQPLPRGALTTTGQECESG